MTTDNDTTPTATDPALLVLHALRLSGFAAVNRIARGAGLPEETVRETLAHAQENGHVVERTGRISGWMLTPDGRTAHASLLARELEALGARAAVESADAAFLQLNKPFKELCSRWQMRADGSLNDHADAEYDQAVISDLEPVHQRVTALTAELATTVPRFERYPRSFAAAYARLLDGDRKAFAAPLSESYHDAWMELHQDLLSTLGRERAAADGH